MIIKEYRNSDYADCLEIIRGNTPDFFAPEEISEFEEFLTELRSSYYVVEVDGTIVACGGWSLRPDGSASLCWGMVKRSEHRKGIGSYLLDERLQLIRSEGSVSSVALVTSQHSQPFFERLGFDVVGIEPDGFSLGLDAVHMRFQIVGPTRPGK
ncbi:GNAT family N-acetyltransferase [Rhodococcus qingshengii]|uniref:GNAT family N-acetyltransferase n=1 Tax=Rhodococcus qingshengii TaxID=334542 RepID=UPI0036D8D01B